MVHSNTNYWLHTVSCGPRTWNEVATRLGENPENKGNSNGIYGIWRSQIGRPRDELTVISSASQDHIDTTGDSIRNTPDVIDIQSRAMHPTLRPADATSPRRQGNYAFRYFSTPAQHYDEFLDLCAGAWPGFESSYDSQVIGLWRFDATGSETIDTLLLTRRPDLAMWERSKIPQGDEEVEVRRKLSRRYDLCESTVVYTSTLLTAQDHSDDVRWA